MMMITLKYEVQLKPSPTICTAIYPKLTYYSITYEIAYNSAGLSV